MNICGSAVWNILFVFCSFSLSPVWHYSLVCNWRLIPGFILLSYLSRWFALTGTIGKVDLLDHWEWTKWILKSFRQKQRDESELITSGRLVLNCLIWEHIPRIRNEFGWARISFHWSWKHCSVTNAAMQLSKFKMLPMHPAIIHCLCLFCVLTYWVTICQCEFGSWGGTSATFSAVKTTDLHHLLWVIRG